MKQLMAYCAACEKITPHRKAQGVIVCLLCGYHTQAKI